jgi:xylulokinase
MTSVPRVNVTRSTAVLAGNALSRSAGIWPCQVSLRQRSCEEKENEPDIYARCAHVLLPKDYIRYKLTGEYAMDKVDGAGTVLFDLRLRNWSDELLAALEMLRTWMPVTYEGTEVTGVITEEAATLTGLSAGTPVVAGGGDQVAGAVGMGAVEPGVVSLTVGTSGVVFTTTPSTLIEPEGRLHAFCHAFPGM